MVAVLVPRLTSQAGHSAVAQGSGAPKVGYVRPGGMGQWKVGEKHTNRGQTPQTVHARIEATKSGQAGTIEALLFDSSANFTPSSASVCWHGDVKLPHASLVMTVPVGASFQIKLDGNIDENNVHISVFQQTE